MQINYKRTTYAFAIAFVLSLLVTFVVLAGNVDSPSPPTDSASQMYTLEQIYNRLTVGAAATKMTTFTEPDSGPGAGTMHTLDDFWEAMRSTHTRVPKTGQTDCWDEEGFLPISCAGTGQDGEYQLGVSPEQEPTGGGPTGAYTVYGWGGTRFTDNGDGTVSDNLTGLIWLKNADCWGTEYWVDALSYCNGLADGSCGLSDGSSAGDWRLPNMNELHSLIDLTQSSPALPSGHPFTGVQANGYYWSSTSGFDAHDYAFTVDLSNGYAFYDRKDSWGIFHIWPVRGGE